MDWNVRKNLKYLLLLLVFCAAIPNLMLHILRSTEPSDFWSPAKLENWSHFFVREWIPFWAALIAYLRLQKMDHFSLLPALEFALIIPTFFFWCDQKGIMAISLTLPLLLIIEFFALLKRMESSGSKILAGLAADRSLLRSFFFWSVGILCVAHIACAWINAKTLPFLLLPIPAVLLYITFRRGIDQLPTVGGLIGILSMMFVSLPLAASGPMEFFKLYHLVTLLIGYALIFLLLIIFYMDHWRKPKEAI